MSHNLNLPNRTFGSKSIARLIKSLSPGVNLNRHEDTRRALELATYLWAVDEPNYAEELLRSFANDMYYSENSGAWEIKEQAMSFLAYLLYLKGEAGAAKKVIVELVDSHPSWSLDDIDWVFEEAKDEILCYEPREKWPEDLTKKELTLGFYSSIVIFTLPFLLAALFTDDQDLVLYSTKKIIGEDMQELREELLDD